MYYDERPVHTPYRAHKLKTHTKLLLCPKAVCIGLVKILRFFLFCIFYGAFYEQGNRIGRKNLDL